MSLECECPVAGWCKRARHRMTETQHGVCSGRLFPEKTQEFREVWAAIGDRAREAGFEKALSLAPKSFGCRSVELKEILLANRKDVAPLIGAGTELKALLKSYGIVPSAKCKCNQRAREMDLRGTEWCRKNIDTIVGWLREEAHSKLIYRPAWSEYRGRWFVIHAIRRARQRNRQRSRPEESSGYANHQPIAAPQPAPIPAVQP